MASNEDIKEGRALFCASFVLELYGLIRSEVVRSRLRRLVIKLEGGPAYSHTIREVLRRYYRIEIGLYSMWPYRAKPKVFQSGTTVGRYSSIADSVRTFTRDHPMNTKSTHGLFYNPELGKVKRRPNQISSLVIGNGVWIGHNAIILPTTRRIGDGAVITAGSVVSSNVPPYAIATGFPARVVGYRFSKERILELLASRWWDKTPAALAKDLEGLWNFRDGLQVDGFSQPAPLSLKTDQKSEGVAQ